jgi:hypothetical protein
MLTLDGRSAEALLTLGRLVKRIGNSEEINCEKPCKGRSHVRCLFNQYSRGTDDSLTDAGLIIWSLSSRRLVVATTTKPNLGHLASASEVAEGHTIPF